MYHITLVLLLCYIISYHIILEGLEEEHARDDLDDRLADEDPVHQDRWPEPLTDILAALRSERLASRHARYLLRSPRV